MVDILKFMEDKYKEGYDIKISMSEGETNGRMQGNTLYMKVKKDLYMQAITKLGQLNNARIAEEKKYDDETNKILGITQKSGKITRNIENANQTNTRGMIDNIKGNKQPEKRRTRKYTGKNMREKMAVLLSIILGGGALAGGVYITGYNSGYSNALEEKTNTELVEMIEKELQLEFSDATGADYEDVRFSKERIGASYLEIEVTDGENTFKREVDLSGTGNSGNLKANNYADLVSEYVNVRDDDNVSRNKLINLYRKVKKERKNKELYKNDKGELRATKSVEENGSELER